MNKTILIVALLLTLLLACQTQSPQNVDFSTTQIYRNPEAGISFKYPAVLTPNTDTIKDRDITGGLVTTTKVYLYATNPVILIYVEALQGPEPIPWMYPPVEEILRSYLMMDIGGLPIKDTDANDKAVRATFDNAQITKIAGLPAATDHLALDFLDVGQMYIHAAVVLSPKRSYTLVVAGGNEPDAPGNIPSSDVDEMWYQLGRSLSLTDP